MKTLDEYLQDGWKFHHEQIVYDNIRKQELGRVQYFHKEGRSQLLVLHPAIGCEREKLFWSPCFDMLSNQPKPMMNGGSNGIR